MKKNKTLVFYAIVAIMAFCLGACEEEEKNTTSLDVSATDLFLDVHGLNEREEPAILNITATDVWSAHCAAWITLTPSTGAIGATQVVVTAGSTDEERTGYITFRSGNQQKVITVNQVPYEAVETELVVTPETISVLSDGLLHDGAIPAIAITSNKTWTLSGYPEWVIPGDIAGNAGTSTVTFNVAAYTATDEDRSATLTVAAGVRSQVVVLTQRKKPSLSVTPATVEVLYSGLLASDGNVPVIAITANETWTLGSNAEWVTPSSTTGSPGAGIPVALTIAQYNSTIEDRSATVTVTLAHLSETVVITQAKKVPTLSSSTVTLNYDGLLADGSTPVFNVTSTSPWMASTTDAWIHLTTHSGPEGATPGSFTVDQNTAAVTRYGAIALTNDDGRSATVTVVQTLDDGKNIGYVYFEDDFAWATGGSDDIGTYKVGTANNIYTSAAAPGSAAGDLLKIFNEHGYTDPCYVSGQNDTRVIYFTSDYLKFGKTAYHGGLTHGIPDIETGRKTNVKLSVDQVTYKSDPNGNPTAGNYDPNGKANITTFALIVVLEGPGSVGIDDGTTKSGVLHDMYETPGTPWAWETVDIVLYGVTSETKVTIKTDQVNTAAMLCRYYLDNLKFEKHSVVTP
jgi:hypothetical protein